MLRVALVAVAGLLVAISFACVPPPNAPPTLGVAAARVRLNAVPTCSSDGKPFLSHVQLLSSGYDPGKNFSGSAPGIAGTPIDPNSLYAAALQNAFAFAPPQLQTRLCNLNGIYVNGPVSCNTTACLSGAWGYRAFNANSQKYIAIPAALWNLGCPGASEYAYHCYESDLLNTVVRWGTANPSPPQYAPANVDTLDMTVLAALAHEVGHIVWYEVFNPRNPGRDYDPNNSNFCGGRFFVNSWESRVHKPPQWRGLGDRNQGSTGPDKHLIAPQISDVDRAIRTGAVTLALTDLDQLYQPSQPWATYLGAISPDEDFVETFKFWVLTNAQSGKVSGDGPLTSLPIQFVAGSGENIPQAFVNSSKTALAAKVSCIGQII